MMGIKDSELDVKMRLTMLAIMIFGGLAVLCICLYLIGFQQGWQAGMSANVQDYMLRHGIIRLPP